MVPVERNIPTLSTSSRDYLWLKGAIICVSNHNNEELTRAHIQISRCFCWWCSDSTVFILNFPRYRWMFPKMLVPPNHPFYQGFHYKPSILGYHYFRKPLDGSSDILKFFNFLPFLQGTEGIVTLSFCLPDSSAVKWKSRGAKWFCPIRLSLYRLNGVKWEVALEMAEQ